MDDHWDSWYDDERNMPKPETLEFRSVEAEVKAAVTDIFDKWERLNWIVERYEPVLQRRWMKRNREQRKKVLPVAWPNMSVMHRPDFYAFQHEAAAQRLTATRFRYAYIYPHINLDDLCQPKNLLLFFNSRGRHTPDTFAHLDLCMCELGRSSCAIVPGDLQGYTMALVGQNTRDTYGRLVYREKVNRTSLMMLDSVEYRAGDGLFILRTQQKVLRFLIHCAETILSDITLDQNFTIPVAPATQSDLLNGESGMKWGSLGVIYLEVPYRVAQQLDVSCLRRLASAKCAEAEDHVWALREDPGYFQEALREHSEHLWECIPTLSGKQQPDLGQPNVYRCVIRMVVTDGYRLLIQWHYVLQELTRLQDVRNSYGDAIVSMQRLPEDYAAALWHFYALLMYMRELPLAKLNRGAQTSPPLRKHYVRVQQDPTAVARVIRRKPAEKDYLLWLLHGMKDGHALFGLSSLLDELERVTRADPAEHARISSYTARALSEVAAIEDIHRTLVLHHSNMCLRYDDDAALQGLQRYMTRLNSILCVFLHADFQLVDVCAPLAKFEYPFWTKRTRPVHVQLCMAEANLDQFWNAVDAHYRRQTGKTFHGMLEGIITEREIQRTPPWTAWVPEPAPASTIRSVELFSQLDLEERTRQGVGAEEPPMLKMKIKTRGTALETASPDAREPLAVEPTPDEASPTNFKLTRRVHKVFSALFLSLGVGRSTGDLPWKEFLYAMASIGFCITKIHGSAWLFQSSWAQERPIIFHELHPASRIQFHHLRRHGRRLGRAYGWDYHMFELIERK